MSEEEPNSVIVDTEDLGRHELLERMLPDQTQLVEPFGDRISAAVGEPVR